MKNERSLNDRTELLYETDSYAESFDAKVLSCSPFENFERFKTAKENEGKNLYAVELDRTLFFPEGGGQHSDTGKINDSDVTDVFKENGCVYHVVSQPFENGVSIHGEINFRQRYRNMQNHSGEHLVCGLIHSIYGYDNVGFHLSNDLITVDVNGMLVQEDFDKIETLANRAVSERREIRAIYPENPDEMEFRSKLELEERIRVIDIDGYDVCACCAPHLKNTAEIGIIKILDFMKHRNGTRFTLQCGESAYETLRQIYSQNREIMNLLSAKREECYEAVKRQYDQIQQYHENEIALKKEITNLYIEKLNNQPVFFTESLDNVQVRNIINETVKNGQSPVAGFLKQGSGRYQYIVGKSKDCTVDLKQLSKALNGAFNGRGGGSDIMVQGSLTADENSISEFLKQYIPQK